MDSIPNTENNIFDVAAENFDPDLVPTVLDTIDDDADVCQLSRLRQAPRDCWKKESVIWARTIPDEELIF